MGFEANTKSGGRKPETMLMPGLDGKDMHVFVSSASPLPSKSSETSHQQSVSPVATNKWAAIKSRATTYATMELTFVTARTI